MPARGLSVRDIGDAFRADDGRLRLSRTAVSGPGAQLWRDDQDVVTRDPGEHGIVCLFVDGVAGRIRPGQRREPVMAAWGFTATGVLLHLMAGSREDAGTVTAVFQDMRARGPGDPPPVVSGGAPGVSTAIETCFPRPARQRGRAHRMRNRAARVPGDVWPEVKARVQAACQAPGRAIARDLAKRVVDDFGRDLPSAVACFEGDCEACIAHVRSPAPHRRAAPTTNLLERLFVEERRRLKIIPNAFGERPVPKLMSGAMTRAAERRRPIRFTDVERRQIAAVRKDPDAECETADTTPSAPPTIRTASRISSTSRT